MVFPVKVMSPPAEMFTAVWLPPLPVSAEISELVIVKPVTELGTVTAGVAVWFTVIFALFSATSSAVTVTGADAVKLFTVMLLSMVIASTTSPVTVRTSPGCALSMAVSQTIGRRQRTSYNRIIKRFFLMAYALKVSAMPFFKFPSASSISLFSNAAS